MPKALNTLALLIGVALIGITRDDTRNSRQSDSLEQGVRVPAYHDSLPVSPLPPVLSSSNFKDNLTRNAYIAAKRIPAVLYQMPCYCYCDRTNGHKSLHECFINKHAANCSVCQREALYSYEQHRLGQTAVQIRKHIMAADWADLDVSRYEKQLLR